MNFKQAIHKRWAEGSAVCVGIDPYLDRLPSGFKATKSDMLAFNKAIIDATADLVCCYKPQFAHFAAIGAETELKATIDYIRTHHPEIPIILDSKRGDIGSTAEMYAKEAFEQYGANAVTVNPYMGSDTVLPFAQHADHGVIVLCRTSNPSAQEFQNRQIEGEPLYVHVAKMAEQHWNSHGNVSLVVGATAPKEMQAIRAAAPTLPFLVPGIGAQGGDLNATLAAGRWHEGYGLMINSSRAILYAANNEHFAEAARNETLNLRSAIQEFERAANAP